jgi:hypothetical protein
MKIQAVSAFIQFNASKTNAFWLDTTPNKYAASDAGDCVVQTIMQGGSVDTWL